jgi:hypothetical protein
MHGRLSGRRAERFIVRMVTRRVGCCFEGLKSNALHCVNEGFTMLALFGVDLQHGFNHIQYFGR